MQAGDLQAWREWQKNQSPQNLQAVLDRLDPVIQKEVNRWTGSLSRPLLELEAKRIAVEAIRSFSPTGGAALATHVVNQLKKLSRISYTYQNVARIPEYQTLQLKTYESARTDLESKTGREPTSDEISSRLGWSKPYTERFQRSLRKEFVESGEPPPIFDRDSGEQGLVDFVYHDLSPVQKKIFEHTTGYGGTKILTGSELMKKLKITQGQLSYQKKVMTQKIQDQMGIKG